MCIQDYEDRMEGVYAQDELNIWANAPFSLLSKSSVQKGGPYFGELTVVYIVHKMFCFFLQEPPVKNPKLGELTDRIYALSFVQSYSVFLPTQLPGLYPAAWAAALPGQEKVWDPEHTIINRFSVLTTVEPCRHHSTADTYPENSESPDSYSVHFST